MRAAASLLVALILASVAGAHPFDDRALMQTNCHIVSDRELVISILYNFTGAASSYTEVWKLDANHDGRVTLEERDKRMMALAQERLDNMELKVGGKRVKLVVDPASFQCLDMSNPERDFSGPDTFPTDRVWLGYAMSFKGRLDGVELTEILEGKFSYLSPAERIEDPDLQFKVYDERVNPAVALSGVSWTKRANGPYVFTFFWRVSELNKPAPPPEKATETPPEKAPTQAARAELDRMAQAPRDDKNREGFFRELFDTLRSGGGSFHYWALALLFVFGWGAWHALQPGHGKTLVASYLIGTYGRVSDALFLGVVVTLAHTSGVLMLLGGLAAVQAWMPDLFEDPTKSLAEWISVAVGATILFMGVGLLLKRAGGDTHEHDIFGRHVHGEGDHQHEALDPKKMSRWEVLRLGILGGIVPCPAAFVIALISIDRHMLLAGLVLVLVFSLGLALVLSFIGLMLVTTKGYMRARQKERRGPVYRFFETKVPVIGALAITLIGFTMVLMALLRLGVLDLSTFTV